LEKIAFKLCKHLFKLELLAGALAPVEHCLTLRRNPICDQARLRTRRDQLESFRI